MFLNILYALFYLILKATLSLDITVRELRLRSTQKFIQIKYLLYEKDEI